MLIPPKYVLTSTITQLLSAIQASKEVIDTYPLPIEIENNIRRRSVLKSSVYSARIEGSEVTMEQMDITPSLAQKKTEVFNILRALQSLAAKEKKDLTPSDILSIHQITMKGITPDGGRFRTEVSAIFNAAGMAIYMPPPPEQIAPLMERLLAFAKSLQESFVPIKAVLAHYIFEKIHPFLDGNGRVGRIVIQKILAHGGYGMKGLLPIEEYLDTHRSTYYRMLELPQQDVTEYVEFMLSGIAETASKAKELVLAKKNVDSEEYLLPRRSEILSIIRDHHIVSFDQIRRRFMMVNPRTLRYDLQQLARKGFIKKRGTTKGACYQAVQ